jgi:hypothetical protein
VGEVTIRIHPHNGSAEQIVNLQTGDAYTRTFSGHGASTDIIVASARAYMGALNKMIAARAERKVNGGDPANGQESPTSMTLDEEHKVTS